MSDHESVVDLQERRDADWLGGLATAKNGAIIGDDRNVILALRTAPVLKGLLRYDEFALVVEFTRAAPWRHTKLGDRWTDDDDTALMAWLQEQGLPVRGKNVVVDCVSLVAKDTTVHPVREYLDSLKWDGSDRLDHWRENYLGADGPDNYLQGIGRCWLISAVARVYEPGCQVDHMIVLEAAQGAGKSRTARILATRPIWFADSIGDVSNKDAALQLSGRWVIELSELAAVRRAEVESVKGYISRTQDVFRPPYGRRAVTVLRQSVFVGTTNEREYLRDKTGNRRYWPVRCTRIFLEDLERDRDQLWAEAVHYYKQGAQWHPDAALTEMAVIEQEERVLVTEIEVSVTEYLDSLLNRGIRETTTREVFKRALNLDPESERYAEQATRLGAQLSAALARCNWEKVKEVGRGKTKRRLYRYRGE